MPNRLQRYCRVPLDHLLEEAKDWEMTEESVAGKPERVR